MENGLISPSISVCGKRPILVRLEFFSMFADIVIGTLSVQGSEADVTITDTVRSGAEYVLDFAL